MKSFINKRTGYGALSVVLMLGVWKVLSMHYGSDFILPSPETTLFTTIKLFADKAFLAVVGTTILRGLVGFLMAFVLGVGLGIPAGLNSGFKAFLSPVLVVIRSVPVVAFILMALIWFSSDTVPVFIGFLTMFPLICTNVIEGIKNVNPLLVGMARFYRVDQSRIIRQVHIPAIMPFLFSGASNALGIGWRAIIVGEVLSQPQFGIGTVMHTAQTFLNMDVLIAWTLIAVLVSYGFELLLRGAATRPLQKFRHPKKIHTDNQYVTNNCGGKNVTCESLQVSSLCMHYGNLVVFRDFSMEFEQGKITCLLGPSGCGKSTLLNIIGGLIVPDSGELVGFEGKRFSYIFQEPRLLPWKTVRENIEFVVSRELSVAQRHSCVDELLKRVELFDFADYYPSQLSGGMKQRVSIARSFAIDSDIILMDEPLSGLDAALKRTMISWFKQIWSSDRRTVIYVTHDEEEAALVGDFIKRLPSVEVSTT